MTNNGQPGSFGKSKSATIPKSDSQGSLMRRGLDNFLNKMEKRCCTVVTDKKSIHHLPHKIRYIKNNLWRLIKIQKIPLRSGDFNTSVVEECKIEEDQDL